MQRATIKILLFDNVVHALFLFSLLSIIFWLIVRKKITRAMEKELRQAVADVFRNMSPEQKEIIRVYAHDQKDALLSMSAYYEEENMFATRINNIVYYMNCLVGVLLILIVMISIGSIYISCEYRAETLSIIRHVLVESSVVFACVAMIEIFFFTEIVLRYRAVSPSEVRTALYEAIKNHP